MNNSRVLSALVLWQPENQWGLSSFLMFLRQDFSKLGLCYVSSEWWTESWHAWNCKCQKHQEELDQNCSPVQSVTLPLAEDPSSWKTAGSEQHEHFNFGKRCSEWLSSSLGKVVWFFFPACFLISSICFLISCIFHHFSHSMCAVLQDFVLLCASPAGFQTSCDLGSSS